MSYQKSLTQTASFLYSEPYYLTSIKLPSNLGPMSIIMFFQLHWTAVVVMYCIDLSNDQYYATNEALKIVLFFKWIEDPDAWLFNDAKVRWNMNSLSVV